MRDCPLQGCGVDGVVAAFDYRGVSGTVIRAAKLSGCTAAWPALGAVLAEAVRTRGWPLPDLVTGVPVPPRRRRRRGFDHAHLLAEAVARSLGCPVAALLRASPGAPDRGSGSAGPAVAAMRPRCPVPPRILLVDDVVTTGATITAAARALRAGGAHQVRVATVTRAGGHGPP